MKTKQRPPPPVERPGAAAAHSRGVEAVSKNSKFIRLCLRVSSTNEGLQVFGFV